MMMVFRRKQIVVLVLVIMIVAAGYLQYSYNKSSISVEGEKNEKLGEAVYVDQNDIDAVNNSDLVEDGETEYIDASKQANEFFIQARLEREISNSKNTDFLKQITEDTNADQEQKTKAYDQMMQIINNSQKGVKIETLIEERGFKDVVALFSDDGSLDIVVKSPSLTSAQTAQIADIASRHGNIDISGIHIRNIY